MTRITHIDLYRVELPLIHRFQTSSHAKRKLEHILVRMRDADGAEGWGEIASPHGPFYSAETVDTCWSITAAHISPLVFATEWESPTDLYDTVTKIRGNQFARAGIDMAAWALWSAREGVPLSAALGGTRQSVEAGVSLGIEPSIDELLQQVTKRVAEGYRRIKLKIAPGWDLEPVRAVREAFPDTPLHVDANGVYQDDEEHLRVLRHLDRQGLLMIEQPFGPRELVVSARLQRELQTPICLDESVDDPADLDTAIALGSGRILNIKVSRLGGLTPAVRTHDAAMAAGWPVWCGGMHEFGIGRAANVALSSLPGFTLPGDISGSDKYYERDVTTAPIRAEEGSVTVPEVAGLGWLPDEDFIRAHTRDEQHLRAEHRP